MRRFFLEYRNLGERNSQTVSGILDSNAGKMRVSPPGLKTGKESKNAELPFVLSWSHYVFLLGIDKKAERDFYEIEAAHNNWSFRELRRQFDSGLYERLALSRDRRKIMELSKRGQIVERPEDVLKEPYVLEFLGLDDKPAYRERDLESAIIDRLEQFLLELGKGFTFEARQKRLTLGPDSFFVDLVFYNRILRCHVVIDLKIGRLSHQDLGQMQMYVNYFDRYIRTEDENPMIGMILCKSKNDAMVELTLPGDVKVYPKRYQLFLPSKTELRRRVLAWAKEAGDGSGKQKSNGG